MIGRLGRSRFSAFSFATVVLAAAAAGCGGSPAQPAPIVQPPAPPPPPTPEPPPPPPPRLGVTRILAFGDSMTAGTTSPPVAPWSALDAGLPRSYPYKLQALMSARYTDQTIDVLNAGVAGNRASLDRDRFNRSLSQSTPQVVLFMEGANDLNAPLNGGEGINDRIRLTVNSMEDMVRDAGARQIPVMLGTLPPQRPGGRSAGAATFLTRYNDALKVMAGIKGAQIVDVYAQFPLSDIGEDGLHPTEDGYQRLAQIWFDALKARYETAPAAAAASTPAAKDRDAGSALRALQTPAFTPHN